MAGMNSQGQPPLPATGVLTADMQHLSTRDSDLPKLLECDLSPCGCSLTPISPSWRIAAQRTRPEDPAVLLQGHSESPAKKPLPQALRTLPTTAAPVAAGGKREASLRQGL